MLEVHKILALMSPRVFSLVMFLVCAFCISIADAHNWINNPPSRITGLTKSGPCPPRPTNNYQSFVASKGVPFGLEWAIGHPRTYTWFTILKRADEDKLPLITESVLDDYISSAPQGASSKDPGGFLSEKAYDRIHIRWKCPVNCKFGKDAFPVPGVVGGGGNFYEKQITAQDSTYYDRPDDWRPSRKCSCKRNGNDASEVRQYEYKSQYLNNDIRAAYSSTKYPYIVAAFKYRHSFKRPQDYDLARLMIPTSEPDGEYIIQYQWRGYYDCFDVVHLDTGGASPPDIVKDVVWVKTDHCQFKDTSDYSFKNKFKCMVLDANGNVTQCIQHAITAGRNSINVVPLYNPPDVKFPEVNIPFGRNSKFCKENAIRASAGNNSKALVCYSFNRPSDDKKTRCG